MRMGQLSKWLILIAFAVAVSAAVAKADGDPSSRWQAPGGGGTPGVDNEFNLAAFGTTGGGCTFDGSTEDCILKNQSNTDWTWATLTSTEVLPCLDGMGNPNITVSTNMFQNASCSNNEAGDAVLNFSGVVYNGAINTLLSVVNESLGACNPFDDPTCNATFIQTELVSGPPFKGDCSPSGGSVPGVLIGCDFEILLGPGPDGGDWMPGTGFAGVAPEPSTFGMLLMGLVGLPFAVRRRKSAISA
jgi:hypothetical protein